MTGLIIALLIGAVLFTLMAYGDTVEAGLVGIWEALVGVWRTLDRLRRDGR